MRHIQSASVWAYANDIFEFFFLLGFEANFNIQGTFSEKTWPHLICSMTYSMMGWTTHEIFLVIYILVMLFGDETYFYRWHKTKYLCRKWWRMLPLYSMRNSSCSPIQVTRVPNFWKLVFRVRKTSYRVYTEVNLRQNRPPKTS